MLPKKNSIAIVGTRGLPSRYGGFETLVEYLVKNNSVNFTVYCSKETKISYDYPNNVKFIKIYLSANGWQSILYDFICIFHALFYSEKVLVLGSSAGILMPIFYPFKRKIVLNFGGLDWDRSKWNFFAKKFLKISEFLAIKSSGKIISDNIQISNYVNEKYNRDSHFIAYGGDQTVKTNNQKFLKKYKLNDIKYFITVARIQSDNNILMILEAFLLKEQLNIVVIGNWNNSDYGKQLKNRFKDKKNIYLIDAIYDLEILNSLRSSSIGIIHGHSAGGSNPSLIESMFLEKILFCYSSGFNEQTTNYSANYFKNKEELVLLLENYMKSNIKYNENLILFAKSNYRWNLIVDKYLNILK